MQRFSQVLLLEAEIFFKTSNEFVTPNNLSVAFRDGNLNSEKDYLKFIERMLALNSQEKSTSF